MRLVTARAELVMSRQRLWLALPVALPAASDVAPTLEGQNPAYWAGDFARAHELNPIGYLLLRGHPLIFAGAGAGWVALQAIAIGRLPGSSAASAAFLAAFLHAIGGATWLWQVETVGAGLAVAYLIAAERLVGHSWRRAGYRA